MPPRDWFDTSASAGDESMRDDSAHRQEIPSSISTIFRLLEDEERLLNRSFPTRTHANERQAREPSMPEIPNEHGGELALSVILFILMLCSRPRFGSIQKVLSCRLAT